MISLVNGLSADTCTIAWKYFPCLEVIRFPDLVTKVLSAVLLQSVTDRLRLGVAPVHSTAKSAESLWVSVPPKPDNHTCTLVIGLAKV